MRCRSLVWARALVAGMAMAPVLAVGQNIQYYFEGTVEATDPEIGFPSPRNISEDIPVKIGDPVSGFIRVPIPINDRWFVPFGTMACYRSLQRDSNHLVYQVNVAGHSVRTWGLGFTESFIADNDRQPNPESEEMNVLYPLARDQEADSFSIGAAIAALTPNPSGSLLDREPLHPLPKDVWLIYSWINFTDLTATIRDGDTYPDTFDLEDYDIAKGFIGVESRNSDGESIRTPGGVQFNIDKMTRVDSSRTVEETYRRTGFHESDIQISHGESVTLRGVGPLGSVWRRHGKSFETEERFEHTIESATYADSGNYQLSFDSEAANARIQVINPSPELVPLEIEGWNADAIFLEGEDPSVHVSLEPRRRPLFYGSGYHGYHYGLSSYRQFTSESDSTVNYQLQPYDGNNVLLLDELSDTDGISGAGSLVLATPAAYRKIAVLGASTRGSGDEILILHFADGGVSEEIDVTFGRWELRIPDEKGLSISGLGTVTVDSQSIVHTLYNDIGVGIYDHVIDLEALGLAEKKIARLEFRRTGRRQNPTAVFAVSGQALHGVAGGPEISISRNSAGELLLRVETEDVESVSIECSEDLNSWDTIAVDGGLVNGGYEVSIALAEGVPMKFYRARRVSAGSVE